MNAPPLSRTRVTVLLPGLVLFAAVILAYQPAWHAGFIWDDDDYVTNNPLLTAPDGLWRIWFSLDSPSQYFPLTYTVFRLEHALWGLHPAGYHWVNLILHAANALLLWRLLARLSVPGAWLAAALFALHPVNVESVAWITQLKNVLSLFFSLLTLRAWTEFVLSPESPHASRLTHHGPEPAVPSPQSSVFSLQSAIGNRQSAIHYCLALVCFALALFSKTTACTLPAALLLILWLKHKPIGWPRLAQVAPFVAMGVAMGFVSMWWERHHQGTEGAVYAIGFLDRALIASRAVWFYFGKLVWPANLSFNYPLWQINPSNPFAYGWLAAGAGLGVAIYFARRFAGRGLEVAALFFVVTLSPLLGFIMLYTFRYTFVADHYQYVAMIGPAALAAAGISRGLKIQNSKFKIQNSTLPCLALLLILAALTWRQCRMYADLETLWQTTLERNPRSFMAHNNLGALLLQRGQYEEAMARFQQALEIQPDSPNARFNMAQLLIQQRRLEEAAVHLRAILEVQPNDPKAHTDLGVVLLQTGHAEEALAHARKALEIQPGFAEGHNNLGWIRLQLGQVEAAIGHWRDALKCEPDHAGALYNLANACFQLGRPDEALVHYQALLQLQPDNAELRNNLGWVLLQSGRTEEAIACFQTVLKLQPDFVMARGNLALAYQQKGLARAAVAEYEAFLQAQPDAVPVLNQLAWLLATWPEASARNGARALELAQRAEQLSGGRDPVILRTLAAAQAETGQFADAARTAGVAVTFAGAQTNAALAGALRLQLQSYEAGLPFREGATNPPAGSLPP